MLKKLLNITEIFIKIDVVDFIIKEEKALDKYMETFEKSSQYNQKELIVNLYIVKII